MDDLEWVLNNSRVHRVDLSNNEAEVELLGVPRTVEVSVNSKGEIWFEGVALCFPTGNKLLSGFARISNWVDDPKNYLKLGKPAGYHKTDWFLAAVRTHSGDRADLSIRGWYDEVTNLESDQRQYFAVRRKSQSRKKRQK